ncbi:hypothetical protein ACFWGN_13355 [Oerskovia sp. NPDC060338]|uniref:hypothetical protein n=1 Tax=Oerskovia sp. NPDC060338 TaxID=3347100 RepID=UPI0036620DF5
MRRTAGLVVLSFLGLLTTGCAAYAPGGSGSHGIWADDTDDFGNYEEPAIYVPEEGVPEEYDLEYQWEQMVPEQPAAWSCYLSITFNEDWHDDVECSNGIDFDRPYLREWDGFVTEDELMQSALEYENALNGG